MYSCTQSSILAVFDYNILNLCAEIFVPLSCIIGVFLLIV